MTVTLLIGTPGHAAAAGHDGHQAKAIRPGGTNQQLDAQQLRRDMRKLWTDHVIWTREYIVAALAGTPDAGAAASRLMKNQEDIGNAVASFYGRPAGDRLTALLKDHIKVAVDVVAAAKAGRQAELAAASGRWTQNAEEIATFLSGANPNWPKAALSDMMAMHLATTTREVVARLNGKWDEDVAAFDEVYAHILTMADALSDGIVKQFASGGAR
jgi:hypothetical protein